MDEKFYKEWFLGFAEGLNRMTEDSRSCMLRCCDLYTTGGVHTPSLCECSRQSILYVGKEVWGKDVPFSVCQEGTILTGKKERTFRIVFEDDNAR